MSNRRKRIDKNQTSIFDLIAEIKAPKPMPSPSGLFRIIDDLRKSLRDAIDKSPLSRHQIAGEMSHLLDESITKAQIDSWTRDTDDNNGPNRRHVPAEYLPAFCEVTGSDIPIHIQASKIERHLLPPRKAIDAEITEIKRQNAEGSKLIRRLELLREEVVKR
jgi:hypothetical protein